MREVQKMALPVVVDEKGELVALIFYNKNRDRIIYTVQRASEDEIIELLESNNKSNGKEGTGEEQ